MFPVTFFTAKPLKYLCLNQNKALLRVIVEDIVVFYIKVEQYQSYTLEAETFAGRNFRDF